MKMGEVIVAILVILGSFGGGLKIGKDRADKKHDKVVLSLLEEQKIKSNAMYSKLDSLKNLPAKVDTVRLTIDRVEYKTDTLILMNKDIYANTDTIKIELRQLRKEMK